MIVSKSDLVRYATSLTAGNFGTTTASVAIKLMVKYVMS